MDAPLHILYGPRYAIIVNIKQPPIVFKRSPIIYRASLVPVYPFSIFLCNALLYSHPKGNLFSFIFDHDKARL